MIEPIDIERRRCELEQKAREAKSDIETLLGRVPQLCFESFCYFDDSMGKYRHENSKCPVNVSGFSWRAICPFETSDKALQGLESLKLLPMLAMCFENPEYAEYQNPLEEFTQAGCVHRYS